jgi:Kdo2-lipid IVA lauroyltransferase/acyltransferase
MTMPRQKIRRRWFDYLVYLFARLVVAFAQMLTIEQSYALAGLVAWIWYQVDERHRKVGLDNLAMAFGDRYTDAERDRIVWGVYLHFSRMLMEILHTPRKIHLTNWRDRVVLVGHEPIMDQLITGGRPMIFLTGHYGNWELAGYLFGLFGFPTVSIARTLDNPYLDCYLRTFRERTGQSLIPKSGGFDQMVEVLQSGRVLSFLADQDAGQRGVFVDFFGRPASTHKAIALLAIEHKAPVVVGVARRIGPGFRYEIRCEEVIDPVELEGTADDVRILTQRFTAALERLILQDPAQYLWLHRRWKHQPKVKPAAPVVPATTGSVPLIAGTAGPTSRTSA